MTISAGFCYVLFGLLFLICPIVLAVLFKKEKINRILAYVLLGLYIVALVIGVFAKASIKNGVLTINLDYSSGWANKQIRFNVFKTRKVDFLINSVLLFPFGVVYSLFLSYKKQSVKIQLFKVVALGAIIGFLIEFFQFVLPVSRAVQLSDFLLNTISALIGGIYFIVLNYFINFRKK